jgi:DnaJ-class molecular chaperone
MGKDYYAVLGVPRDADANALKKAYRKLAMRWHPDKNQHNQAQAQATFQEISEAYDVLNDPKKRQIYDQFGEEGLKSGGSGAGQTYTFTSRNAEEIFRSFFGDGSPFGGIGGLGGFFSSAFGGGGGSRRGHSGFSFGGDQMFEPEPMVIPVSCTLEQLFAGTTKRLKVTRTVNGRDDEKLFELDIRPGWKDGTKITFEGDGDQRGGKPPQDLVFIIKELRHQVFQREKNNLIVNRSISVEDALCGFVFTGRGIDGREIEVPIRDVITPAGERRLSGQGMPKKGGGRGDLIIRFTVTFPNSLSQDQKEGIRQLLRRF